MTKLPWTPWHQVIRLRDDIRSGELSLAIFAADLYDVIMGRAKPIYQDPAEFFALTYPTFNLRELVKDVLNRLAGKSEKAVRQLELTYGGGKTHTLITLYHLVSDPGRLPDLPAVKEFIQHAGITPPKARVACLPFDKLDAEKGMEIKAPDGRTRWLKHPWSVLAWQIAGPEGLRLLHPDGKDEERPSAPAENLLTEVLSIPGREGLSTLILIDEVLVYAREKIGLDPVWRGRLQDFFQYLTQASTKVERCAVVVSLLASDPRKSDTLGKEIAKEMYDIFRREQEESVQPVVKEDVAEVLRRRLFTPESIRDREAFRPHVMTALKGINELDDQTKREGKAAEERFLQSFPFHPDLTDAFYVKWTQLEGFQRARGVLRTFALALREAEKWDQSPLIAANVFLNVPGSGEISPAARELTTVAASEEYEGRRQEWAGILEGELAKARAIQAETPGLKSREAEQAVLAAFIHSQPIGQRALTRDLLVLLGHTRPDRIEVEKALQRWADVSWFLDEEALSDVETRSDGRKGLPKAWRLGSRPNLRQMHSEACRRVSSEVIEAKLVETIGKMKSLSEGASAAGARAHVLPERPKDIEDDGEFHYAVLGPKATSTAGNASAEAKRFIEETTTPDRPRVYRNAVVLAVPSREGLEVARDRIREYLGWEEVRNMLKGQQLDPLRAELLSANAEDAKKKVAEAVRQAYCLAVTLSEKNEIVAYKLTVGTEPLFNTIKNDPRVRIQETPVTAEALLPDGPYNLWREGEKARRVKDLVGAFAQFPHMPKMLRRKKILETLVQGVKGGLFVFRTMRPDRSVRTIWRAEPSETDLEDPTLELVLPEAATLSEIPSDVLVPGALPGLWTDQLKITVGDIVEYFRGGNLVQVPREGYTEPAVIPGADRGVVYKAIAEAVKCGRLWLTTEVASICAEEIPAGILTDDARLQPPPSPISVTELLPRNLPEAWAEKETTALAIANALSRKAGKVLPWPTVRDAIEGAMKARLLEKTLDSGPWPCPFGGAQQVRLRVPPEEQVRSTAKPPLSPPRPGFKVARAELHAHQIQDLADIVGELLRVTVGYELAFKLEVELGGSKLPPDEVVQEVNKLLTGIAKDLKLE